MQCGLFLTAIWTIILYQNGVQLSKVLAARQPGYLDFDNLPETNFTCEGKVIGGYYADIETGCQMFHVCTIGQKGDMTDIKFLCLNGTVFDQETRVCERVDEVDCSKSKDFYDLNLELYNNGFGGGILPENENETPNTKSESEEEEIEIEEVYDENYDVETEETPLTSTKTTTTSTTTTSTTTTTPKPINFSSIKPTFSIILPNLKNKNTGTHLTGLVPSIHQSSQPTKQPQPQNINVGTHLTGVTPMHQNYGTHVPSGPSNQNKNVGTHLTGLIPNKNAQTTQTQRPYGFVTTPTYDPRPTLDTGLKPPPSQYKPYTSGIPTSSYKPPSVYDTYRSHFFSSSTPNPISSILLNNYNNQKNPGVEEIRPSEQSKRPVVVVSHHFPTIIPSKNNYDSGSDFTSFSSPSAPGAQYTRHKNRPLSVKPIQHMQKYNPTILALQSQQKKVHQLHQQGLVQAEHEIAQVASRNAEISSLRSQKSDEITSRKDDLDPLHRETKEIHAENRSKPSIAIVTSTSSTSSRIQKPGMTFTKTIRIGNSVFKPESEFKTELEKLFEVDKKEEKTDADLDQLLLAWKLKTNQEVTKSDIEKVFSSLDLSKFKNGETISLSDIFNLMHNGSDVTTRLPPTSYDDYTEEDVPFDPFYKDVPKVQNSRSKRDTERIHNVPVKDNGRFTSHETRKRGKNQETEPVRIADIKVITDSPRGRIRARTTETSAINDHLEVTTYRGRRKDRKYDPSLISQNIRGYKTYNSNWTADILEVSTPMPYPKTGFTCKNKIAGGFYADTEVDCKLFHICSDAGNGSLTDHKFFCGEGTRFNQRSRTCQARDVVECNLSTRYYHLNENFRIPPPEEAIPELSFESTRIES